MCSRDPTTTTSSLRPANSRRAGGRTKRPCASRTNSNAPEKTKREKTRAPASEKGSSATRLANLSHSGRGKMARHESIQRLTNAPAASSARNRAGTATRPLASIAWRYSPVNKPLPLVRTLPRLGNGGRIHHLQGPSPRGREIRPPPLPTLGHFGPLRRIVQPKSGPSSPKTHPVPHAPAAYGCGACPEVQRGRVSR